MKQIENIHQFREEKKHNPFSYQRLFGTIHPDAVPEDFKKELNAEKKWKYGYNEQFDIVVISRDGTLGDVYELEGVKIGLPAEPEDKTEILNYDKPKEEQYWKPEVIPKELLDVESEAVAWNARPENRNNILTPTEIFYRKPQKFIDKYLSYINSDFDKREKGVWIYINGKAFWLPPSHYFFIQHIPVKGSILPDFRFTNRDYYLFWEATRADNRCLGMIYLKNRRSGASSMAGSEMLNFATEVYEGFLGVMSKTNKDSISFLNRMVIRTFKKLPWYFKPQTSGTTSASSGLMFSEIAKKMSKKHTTMTANEGLDTSIKQFSTSLNSMDGEAVDMMVLDECFGAGFGVRMYDGSVKNVEDIDVGDVIMGDDSTKRNVLRTVEGIDQMYKITSKFGSYTCNSAHKIRLVHSYKGEVFLTPEEYISMPDKESRYYQEEIKPTKYKEKELLIDPYLLGLWLGDGNSSAGIIYTDDEEIKEYLENNYKLTSIRISNGIYAITIKGFSKKLRELNVFRNKHIPKAYLKSSYKQRLKLLAGLIDTDGYTHSKTGYEISMSREELILQIKELSSSLGFYSKVKYKKTHCVNKGIRKKHDAWRVPIYGNTWDIPVLIERKKVKNLAGKKGRKNPNKSGIKIEKIGVGEYFGFTVDSNNLFLSDNQVVNKNCGKYSRV